jgi:Cys-tRNA(Pro) deacylase
MPAVARVKAVLERRGVSAEILEFPAGTRTAREAAAAVGTTVARIVKSLLFVADGRPVLALVSGAHRVDVRKLGALIPAESVEKATAETTRSVTGFSIGGVPPIGHATLLAVYVDEGLLAHPIVYAAAGTPYAVFAISPRELARITGGVVADIADTAPRLPLQPGAGDTPPS